MSMPTCLSPTINEIINSITNGEYRIPRFQRDFVWDSKKSAALFDSIFKGFPIGSVILWKTKEELSEIRDLGGVEIPGRNTGRYTSYVIDGQQRLTSMYFSLMGLKTSSSDLSNMCISLVAKNNEQLVYDEMPNDASPDNFVKLNDLYTAKALLGSYAEKRLHYYQILLQYKISVIEIDDDSLSLDEVIEVFERLNLGGKKLNLFSIIAARSYKSPDADGKGFDLTNVYNSFNEKLKKTNYGNISDSVFLQCIAACLINKVNTSEIINNLKTDLIIGNYKKVEKALLASIEHLKGTDYGVLVSNLLPYERIIVSFTYFHYYLNNKQISSTQRKYLVDFFWRCVIGKRYNSAADTNLNADLAKIKKIINDELPNQEPITLSPRIIFENGRFLLSSAFVKGILCVLAQTPPQSFAVGRTINITNDSVSASAKKQYHHFFPQKSDVILNNQNYKSMVNNVVNVVFMDALTNDQISNRNPSDYISEFSQNNPNLSQALESHYISLNGFGIENNDYIKFINSRSKSIFDKLSGFIQKQSLDSISDNIAIE